jgi:hypothetical protein
MAKQGIYSTTTRIKNYYKELEIRISQLIKYVCTNADTLQFLQLGSPLLQIEVRV